MAFYNPKERARGSIALSKVGDANDFVEMCRKLRHWEREPKVKQV